MPGKNRAGRLEFQPLARTARWQPVQRGCEFWRGCGWIFLLPRRGLEPDYRIMERPAIGAGNGLNGKMFTLGCAAGDPGVIPTFGTLE